MKQKINEKATLRLTVTAMMTALVFVITRFIQIPIPLGYLTFANVLILLGCLLLPYPYGIVAGSLGSALADLTSFPAYTLPTLLIKALLPLIFYLIVGEKFTWGRASLAAGFALLLPLLGYTLAGGLIYGSLYSGLAQLPGLAIEYLTNLVLFFLLSSSFHKMISRS